MPSNAVHPSALPRPSRRRFPARPVAALASLLIPIAVAAAPSPAAVRDQADARARALVQQLTMDEKLGQLLNVAPAIPRLQIPAYNWWTESLHGALGPLPTTNFPEPIGLAASFDRALMGKVASAISVEVRALHTLGRQSGRLGRIGTGLDTWSPNINLFRDPRWGRGQETYGEDPFLTAELGVSFIRGIQGPNATLPDVVATPKHFAVHSGPEPTRHVANVFVSDHDLEDSYLPAFRAAIVDAQAGSVMCAYNRINGQPACGSAQLLTHFLRGAWGFKGYVVSDCDAVTDIAVHSKYAPDAASAVAVALKAGVDNECNTQTLGDAPDLTKPYRAALQRGLIAARDVDTAVTRLFAARYRNGDLPGIRHIDKPVQPAAINTPAHQALALQAAQNSMVLLKNDGVLPLQPKLRVLVAGPLADATRVLRGNYSSTQSAPPVALLDGLRQAMPQARIAQVPFGASITDGDPVPASALLTPDGKPGLLTQYFNASAAPGTFETSPVASSVEAGLQSHALAMHTVAEKHRVRWSGFLVAPETGTYRIGVSGVKGEVTVDGQPAVSATTYSRWAEPIVLTQVKLVKDQRYRLQFESETSVSGVPGLFWKRISEHPEADLRAAAADADVIVAAVGLTSDLEGEELALEVDGFSGGDKTSLDLPLDQRRFLEQAKALGKPLVVVLMSGSAVNLQWAKENASAILVAWYPGQSGGLAAAQVLAGQVNPAGRLPLTFYQSLADLPPFDDYAMQGRTYRYFKGTPVYPFGSGLSYSAFSYGPLKLVARKGKLENGVTVTTQVTNTSSRDGDEVAQLYLKPPAFEGAPRHALRGFQRLHIKAGERREVAFTLSPRELSFVSRDGQRQIMSGLHSVSVGPGQPAAGAAGVSAPVLLHQSAPLPQ